MNVLKTTLEEVLIIKPTIFSDNRGFFMEMYHQKKYGDSGIETLFVQDNFSCSVRGTLRGLHYQFPNGQAKLVQVIRGEIFDVAVDIRRGSPAFGQWTSVYLSYENKRQLFIPEGFAHGFCVLSETADVIYKCTDFYDPDVEGGILWSDQGIGIAWPIADPLVSEKDRRYSCLSDISDERLPAYRQ